MPKMDRNVKCFANFDLLKDGQVRLISDSANCRMDESLKFSTDFDE